MSVKENLYKLWCGDAMVLLPKKVSEKTIDMVVTSPPYNLNVKYKNYKDNLPRKEYLKWFRKICKRLKKVLKDDGSFFLNMGFSSKDPWIDVDIMNQARELFILQNKIIWVKSISISSDKSFGHFQPINSERYLNKTYETIYHFTKTGEVKIDKLSLGVSYVHPSNLNRWKKEQKKIRCRGNCWFIPYKTITKKSQKGNHPAIFPIELPEFCIKLHGYNKETVVLDPFVGTGTTILAADKLNVKSIGIDIDEDYIKQTKTRIRKEEQRKELYECREIF